MRSDVQKLLGQRTSTWFYLAIIRLMLLSGKNKLEKQDALSIIRSIVFFFMGHLC